VETLTLLEFPVCISRESPRVRDTSSGVAPSCGGVISVIFLRSKALSKRRLGLEFGVSCMSLLHLIFFGTEGSNGTISGRQRKNFAHNLP
jgi:hypothetical protein